MAAAHTLSLPRRLLAVLAGGFLGTIIRYLLSLLLQDLLGKTFPYDILLINVTGAFVLALITTLADASIWVGPTRRLFINVGFLGAYTTFSSLALGDILLFAKGAWGPALLYLALSLSGGIIAVLLGDLAGQSLLKYRIRTKATATPAHTPATQAQSETAAEEEHLDIQDDVITT